MCLLVFFGGARYNQSGFPCIIMIFTLFYWLSLALSLVVLVFFIFRERRLKNGVIKDTLEYGDYALMFLVSFLSLINVLFLFLSTLYDYQSFDFVMVMSLILFSFFITSSLSDYSKKTYIYGREQLGYHFKAKEPYVLFYNLYSSVLLFVNAIFLSVIYYFLVTVMTISYSHINLWIVLAIILVLSLILLVIGLLTLRKPGMMTSGARGITISLLSLVLVMVLVCCYNLFLSALFTLSENSQFISGSYLVTLLTIVLYAIYIVKHIAPNVFDNYRLTFSFKSVFEHINIFSIGFSIMVSLISVGTIILAYAMSLI